ncbi:MAG: CYTH domain-containing protein [Chitinophagaceae bacterium]|nr:MAG: CYTH domain-containing protein [Chitinophagaceae bacterium]
MATLNVEIKARCNTPETVRRYLLDAGAEFRGTDHQVDTYFNVSQGRLKLREGIIENNLIYYERPDQEGPRQSSFRLVKVPDAIGLKAALAASCGILATVDKQRGIYYIGNVKFHIDEVMGLGSFIEIEAFNGDGLHGIDTLRQQCDFYIRELGISQHDLVAVSYSDLLLDKPIN